MTVMKCNSCNGVYDTQTRDGVRYFHVCSQVWDANLKAWVDAPNKRDENIVSTAETSTAVIKSPGSGATKV